MALRDSDNDYKRFDTLGTTTVPSDSRTTKNICRIGPLTVSEKQTSQNGIGVVLNSWVSSAPALYVIKGRHEVRGYLGRLLFGYSVGRVLFACLKDVLQRASILRRASVSKQLDGLGWSRQ
jgi:hypothetical protein